MNNEQLYRLIDKKMTALPFYVEKYIDYRQADQRSKPNTLLSYLYDYERFFSWLLEEGYYKGSAKYVPLSVLEGLKRDDITSFQNYLMRYTNMTKRSSRNRMISSLKSLFHYLSQIEEDEDGNPLLLKNVMAKVEIKGTKPSPREQAETLKGRVFKSREEIDDFLNFVEDDYEDTVMNSYEKEPVKKRLIHYYRRNKLRDVAFLSLILGSGLRVNEAVSLDLDDIDWKEKGVRVERKGKEGKTLILFSNRAYDKLQQYLQMRDKQYQASSKNKAVFLSLPTGPNNDNPSKRWTKRSAQEAVMKYTKWYGKPISVHNLRHSFATVHWSQNRDVFGLQSQLGHNDPQTTQRYALIFDDSLRRAIDKMDGDQENSE